MSWTCEETRLNEKELKNSFRCGREFGLSLVIVLHRRVSYLLCISERAL